MEKHQKMMNDLLSKKGAEFDAAYIDMMFMDHEEDIQKFENEATNGSDAEIKAFASKTLPVLKMHYDRVKSVKDSMKK
jgi:putative membrane protein